MQDRCGPRRPREPRSLESSRTRRGMSAGRLVPFRCRTVWRVSVPAVDRQVLELAVDVAYRAGQVAAGRFFAADFSTSRKADGTEVTGADVAVEELSGLNCCAVALGMRFMARRPVEPRGRRGGAGSSTRSTARPISPAGSRCSGRCWPTRTSTARQPASSVTRSRSRSILAGRGLGCWVRTGAAAGQPPVLRAGGSLRQARVQVVNPGTWHASLLLALHENVTITGELGGVAGMLTGLLDAVVVAGLPQGYEDLAPLPVILAEAARHGDRSVRRPGSIRARNSPDQHRPPARRTADPGRRPAPRPTTRLSSPHAVRQMRMRLRSGDVTCIDALGRAAQRIGECRTGSLACLRERGVLSVLAARTVEAGNCRMPVPHRVLRRPAQLRA